MLRPLKPYQLITDVVIAAVFAVAIGAWEVARPTSFTGSGYAGAAVGLLFAGALALRRLWPGGALIVAWVTAVLQMTLLLGPRPSDIAVFAVLYVTAAYGTRAVYWSGFVSAIMGAVVITGYLFVIATDFTPSTLPTASAVLVAALFALLLSWTLGALVRTALRARANRLAQERAEADAAVEQERVRIARDMHDVVAHSLAVVIAQADGARYAAATEPAAAADALATISATSRAALADVRLLLTRLRHNESDGPQPGLADLEALFEQARAAGVDLRVEIDPAPPPDSSSAVQVTVFRILQEALTNALRHGDSRPVTVRVAWVADRVDLEVRNGRRANAAGGSGHGLVGMRERAQLVGGRLHAGQDGDAFTVRATLPAGAGR